MREILVQLWTGAVVVDRLRPDDAEPDVAALDAIATAWTASNDGIRPNVRVLERSTVGRWRGPAGSLPR